MDAVPEYALATLIEANAARIPDRPAVVWRDLTLRYADLADRSRRLARYLAERGLGAHRERAGLAGHECGQDLLGQYLHNGPAYLEGLLGCSGARVAPFNVNYRYVADELRYLLRDARPRAVQYHACFAGRLAEVLADVPPVEVLLQVDDGSGAPLLPGAVDYEQALASVPSEVIGVTPSPDDRYVLYTGGTTGMPKGVLWRQADAAVALFGVRDRRSGREWASEAERLAALAPAQRVLLLCPLMHGGAQIAGLHALAEGHAVVFPDDVRRFDPADALDAVARHGVTAVAIVGDAFGRPLADELTARPRALPTWRLLVSGGAALSAVHKDRLRAAVGELTVVESIGASETGVQGRMTGSGAPAFVADPGTLVLAEDRATPVAPGTTGWLASAGRVPLGYLGDAERTARTFPVVGGRRLAVPGDRARLLADGRVELLGRESTTINTGGEKVFAEEVEAVLRSHPGVVDAIVCGRPSRRWGAEVVAVLALRDGLDLDEPDLRAHCAARLAGYKLPKAFVVVAQVRRAPSGKPDVGWARAVAAGSLI